MGAWYLISHDIYVYEYYRKFSLLEVRWLAATSLEGVFHIILCAHVHVHVQNFYPSFHALTYYYSSMLVTCNWIFAFQHNSSMLTKLAYMLVWMGL